MKSPLPWPPPKNWHRLWPALKGSLAKIYKPCIRPDCPRCAQGIKHAAFILSFTQKGKRRCMYVPEALVPLIQQALKNGRRLEELLYAAGPRLLQAYRRQRDQKISRPPKETSKPHKSATNPDKRPIKTSIRTSKS